MRKTLRQTWLGWARNQQGSFTLEASLVFPMILLCTIALLFVGLFVYQKVYLHQAAGLAAERAAFVWDNSYKDPLTGTFVPGKQDGLYWRIGQDSLSDLFSFLLPTAPTTINLPSQQGKGQLTEGPAKKLDHAAHFIPAGISGSLTYVNHGWERTVTAKLHKPFQWPRFRWGSSLGPIKIETEASSHVVDPVEFIRTIDLTRTYIGAIKGRISPKAAKEALTEPALAKLPKGNSPIRSEREASSYLRKLVSGTQMELKTKSGETRTVDALDANQIAHQAFYTFTENQLRDEQLTKDAQLLRENTAVKGVVWHFFRTGSSGSVGPSASFRKELERKGVVVVIHD